MTTSQSRRRAGSTMAVLRKLYMLLSRVCVDVSRIIRSDTGAVTRRETALL